METVSYNEISIFIASSGEMKEEREALTELIRKTSTNEFEKNRKIKLKPVIWEEESHSIKGHRIQDNFNEELIKSDIAIVMFHTYIGKYTEEEFKLAYKNIKAGKKPYHMFLYFKKLENYHDKKNRENIKKIWNLQEEIERLGEYYEEFEKIDELESKVKKQLRSHIETIVKESFHNLEPIVNRSISKKNSATTSSEDKLYDIEEDLVNHKEVFEDLVKLGNWEIITKYSKNIRNKISISEISNIDLSSYPTISFFWEHIQYARIKLALLQFERTNDWQKAIHKIEEIKSKWPHLYSEDDLNYAEGRKIFESGDLSKAKEKFECCSVEYRDVRKRLADIQKIMDNAEEDKNFIDQLIKDEKWKEAEKACKDFIKTFEINQEFVKTSKALESLLEILEKLNSSFVIDPLYQNICEEKNPYTAFLSTTPPFTPDSDMKCIKNTPMQHQNTNKQEWDKLRITQSRMYIDVYLYPVENREDIIKYITQYIQKNKTFPSLNDAAISKNDKAVLSLINGDRKSAEKIWSALQKKDPSNTGLAHRLAILYEYWAKQLIKDSQIDEANKKWQLAIGNWSLVLEDNSFWTQFKEVRHKIYDVEITDTHLEKLKKQILSHLYSSLNAYPTLVLELHSEIAALKKLKKSDGIETTHGNKNVYAGPIMLSVFDLQKQSACLFKKYFSHHSDIVSKLTSSEAVGLSARYLRRYYSCLIYAMALLDRGQEEKALKALTTEYPRCKDIECPIEVNEHKPFVCPDNCTNFDKKNPSYALLPDKNKILYIDAMNIAIKAHLNISKKIIAQNQINVKQLKEHWNQAIIFEKEKDNIEQVKEEIISISMGRLRNILKKADHDSLEWCNNGILIAETALECIGTYKELEILYAKLLTNRGINKANIHDDYKGSEIDLKKAYKLNPTSSHIIYNYSLSLLKLSESDHINRFTSLDILRQAEKILTAGLENDPNNKELIEQMDIIQRRRGTSAIINEDDDPLSSLREIIDTPQNHEEKISNLFEKWKQKKTKEEQDKLIEAVIEFTKKLGEQKKYTDATSELSKWLDIFPQSVKIQKQMAFMSIGYNGINLIEKTDLKYTLDLLNEQQYIFKFDSKFVVVQIDGDIIKVSSNLSHIANEDLSEIAIVLLKCTMNFNCYKACINQSRNILITSDLSVSHLTPDQLEAIIRRTANLVNVKYSSLKSNRALETHYLEFAEAQELLSNPFLWKTNLIQEEKFSRVCEKNNISCVKKKGIFYVTLNSNVDIEVRFSDHIVSFSKTVGKMNDQKINRILEINNQMDLCKIVLNQADHIVFVIELIGIDETILINAVKSFEKYLTLYANELI